MRIPFRQILTSLAIGALTASAIVRAADAAATEEQFPTSLVEFAPQLSFIDQIYPIAGTNYHSYANPGAVIRFTPIWRGKYPIYFHFGGTQVNEVNDAGVIVDGEHGPLKYIWTFGARFGFSPLDGLILSTGLEFNHEPFLTDQTPNHVFLNKILIPTFVFMGSYEWLRTPKFSALLDLAVKAYFTVPMDTYLMRNGLVFAVRGTGRYRLDDDFQLFASVLGERRGMSTNIGDLGFLNLGFEVGIGWGYGK